MISLAAAGGANAADWIAAIGQVAGALLTAGAVAVAVALALREGRWRREDQAERERERLDGNLPKRGRSPSSRRSTSQASSARTTLP